MKTIFFLTGGSILFVILSVAVTNADEPAAVVKPANKRLTRISEKDAVWIDVERKLVVIDAKICAREAPLEMFVCTPNTKEHESVIVVDSSAYIIHAALLAVGAKPGSPVRFDPEYAAANGTEIDVLILWTDKDGKRHKARGQEWVKRSSNGKQLEHPWVFAGSGFWVDQRTGKKHYHAEGGDLICVSNFPTAMLDIPVESSQANDGLLYMPFTERIPPIDTKVRLVLAPKLEKRP